MLVSLLAAHAPAVSSLVQHPDTTAGCMLCVLPSLQGYSDGPSARCGGAELGLLAALVATRTGARRAVWQRASAAAGKP
jgi:hypothetical protein